MFRKCAVHAMKSCHMNLWMGWPSRRQRHS